MAARMLGTLTIGQAPRRDVVPIIEKHAPAGTRLVHRGALDGMSRADVAAQFAPDAGEAALITSLHDGGSVLLSRIRMRHQVQRVVHRLEDDGCDVILVLCTGTFEGLESRKAWLVEPDHIIPATVAGLVEQRQLGILVPIAGQITSEAAKWRLLARTPRFAFASPYGDDGDDAVPRAGEELKTQGAEGILLDCIGFTERHRAMLSPLGLPVILSNAIVAKAVGELLEG
ncbi:MAG TPA: AroM family protein [Stellaceae bacterium]|jgi:protein AroM|nr:AroM family protein [Stellaceae bacterium]